MNYGNEAQVSKASAQIWQSRAGMKSTKDGGKIGMVLPHSTLQSGQYSKWRSGQWQAQSMGRGRNRVVRRTLAADFRCKAAWDLESLEPNTFFPITSCVALAQRMGDNAGVTPLAGTVERWEDQAGADDVLRVSIGITDTSVADDSPYANHAPQRVPPRPR